MGTEKQRKAHGRREQAQELRREGLTYNEIGLIMGISRVGAYWLVHPEKKNAAARRRRIKG